MLDAARHGDCEVLAGADVYQGDTAQRYHRGREREARHSQILRAIVPPERPPSHTTVAEREQRIRPRMNHEDHLVVA